MQNPARIGAEVAIGSPIKNGTARHRFFHVCRIGRGGEIRTRDPYNPIVVRYQAALRPDGRQKRRRILTGFPATPTRADDFLARSSR